MLPGRVHTKGRGEAMSDQPAASLDHEQPGCALCAQPLASDDCIATIRLPSHAHGHRYFGAHVRCWRQAVRPEIAEFIDLADVPPGLDHFLTSRPRANDLANR